MLPLIYILDDIEAVRGTINGLVRSAGYRSVLLASALAFLERGRLQDAACPILDVNLPGFTGLDLQRRCSRVEHPTSIVFVTAEADGQVP